MIIFLKAGVPLIQAVGNVVDAIDTQKLAAQLTLLEKITEALPEIEEAESANPKEKHLQSGMTTPTGPALRFLHSFLKEVDSTTAPNNHPGWQYSLALRKACRSLCCATTFTESIRKAQKGPNS